MSLITFPTEMVREKYMIMEMRMIRITTIVFLDSFCAFVSFAINAAKFVKIFPFFKNPSPSYVSGPQTNVELFLVYFTPFFNALQRKEETDHIEFLPYGFYKFLRSFIVPYLLWF